MGISLKISAVGCWVWLDVENAKILPWISCKCHWSSKTPVVNSETVILYVCKMLFSLPAGVFSSFLVLSLLVFLVSSPTNIKILAISRKEKILYNFYYGRNNRNCTEVDPENVNGGFWKDRPLLYVVLQIWHSVCLSPYS